MNASNPRMAAQRSNACFTGEEVIGLLDLDGVEEDVFPGSDDELGFSEEEERYTNIPYIYTNK